MDLFTGSIKKKKKKTKTNNLNFKTKLLSAKSQKNKHHLSVSRF